MLYWGLCVSHSVMSNSLQRHALGPCQAPRSVGFSRQEYWSGLPFPSPKKAECQRIDDFCWRRLLKVPWTARRFNQCILKENRPKYSLEGLMLKMKLQYFGHLMWKADSFEKTLRLGKIEGGRRRGRQRMRCWMASLTQRTWVWVNSRSCWWIERPGVPQSMGSQSQTWLRN